MAAFAGRTAATINWRENGAYQQKVLADAAVCA
jgi:hypothetical protein